MNRKRSPKRESPEPVPAVSVSKTAPVAPINIPTDFFQVIFSFNMKKDKITTRIGLIVMIIPALIDEDKFSPLKKNN